MKLYCNTLNYYFFLIVKYKKYLLLLVHLREITFKKTLFFSSLKFYTLQISSIFL